MKKNMEISWEKMLDLREKIPNPWGKMPGLWGKIPNLWGKIPERWGKMLDLREKIPNRWEKMPGLWYNFPFTMAGAILRRIGLSPKLPGALALGLGASKK